MHIRNKPRKLQSWIKYIRISNTLTLIHIYACCLNKLTMKWQSQNLRNNNGVHGVCKKSIHQWRPNKRMRKCIWKTNCKCNAINFANKKGVNKFCSDCIWHTLLHFLLLLLCWKLKEIWAFRTLPQRFIGCSAKWAIKRWQR